MRAALALLASALTFACSRGMHRVTATDAAPGAAAAGVGGMAETSVFSAPIAALRMKGIDVVAGLVVAASAVRVTAVDEGGQAWSVEVLTGVQWASDAELRIVPADDGFAVVWSGLRGAKAGRTLAQLGPHGEPRVGPIEIGAAFCGTSDGLAWLGRRTDGSMPVWARRWSERDAHEVLTIARDREASLVCGDHDVIVLGDGGEDVSISTFGPGDLHAKPALIVMRDADFSDEEREHEAYSSGDDLGFLRVGVSGAMSIRASTRSQGLGAWRKLKHVVPEDDEIVAVDGDEHATLVVTTHEVERDCPGLGSTAECIRVIVVDRATGDESEMDLSPPDCGRMPGPFWIAPRPGGPIVAWVERREGMPAKTPPIGGLAFGVLGSNGVRRGRVDQPADAMVDCGCDHRGCAIAALVRGPGNDGTSPGPIRIFPYP